MGSVVRTVVCCYKGVLQARTNETTRVCAPAPFTVGTQALRKNIGTQSEAKKEGKASLLSSIRCWWNPSAGKRATSTTRISGVVIPPRFRRPVGDSMPDAEDLLLDGRFTQLQLFGDLERQSIPFPTTSPLDSSSSENHSSSTPRLKAWRCRSC